MFHVILNDCLLNNMSWPEYLTSNSTPQDGDDENTYFISDTLEFETSMV